MNQRRRGRRDLRDLTGTGVRPYYRVSRADKRDRRAGLEAERSTSTQRRIFTDWARREAVTAGREYCDPDISASWFNSKRKDDESGWDEALRLRPDFAALVADIQAGELNGEGLWFWRISRQARELEVFVRLRDLCRAHDIFWVVDGEVYDTGNHRQMKRLLQDAADAEGDSWELSENVYDGKQSAALKGRRAGRIPYGYRATYDPATGEPAGDVADHGKPGEPGPADIVAEMYARVDTGETITRVRKDLNTRGIRTRDGYQWHNQTIRNLLLNPAYAGLRTYQRDQHDTLQQAILDGVKTSWPPLISEELFWRVYNLLTDPARTTNPGGRPRHSVYLLSGLGTCGVCGGKLVRRPSKSKTGRRAQYVCRDNACIGIDMAALDDFTAGRIVAWLSDPVVAAQLQPVDETADARAARAELEKARAELRGWKRAAERREIDADMFVRMQRVCRKQIDAARKRLDTHAPHRLPPRAVGPAARAGWDALDITAQRAVVAEVAAVEVLQVGRENGGPHRVHPAYRVRWTWKLLNAGTVEPLSLEELKADLAELRAQRKRRRDYVSAERREAITALLREDPEQADRQIAVRAGRIDRHAIRRLRAELEQAGEIPVIRRPDRWRVINHGYVTQPPAEAAAS